MEVVTILEYIKQTVHVDIKEEVSETMKECREDIDVHKL